MGGRGGSGIFRNEGGKKGSQNGALNPSRNYEFHKSGLVYFVKMTQLKKKNPVIFKELLHGNRVVSLAECLLKSIQHWLTWH